MVIFLEWHRTSLDPKSSSSLPMSSEGTGLEALASPLAGYLEKVQARAASLEYCPWCAAKGSTYALRSYHVNLQESITLCTNPQCLFPLVTRPLEDVLASLEPVESTVGTKRKTTLEEEDELIKPATKRLRSTPQDAASVPVGAEENGAASGQHAPTLIDDEKINGSQTEYPVSEATERKSRVNGTDAEEDSVSVAQEEGPALNACLVSFVRSSEGLQTDDGVDAAASPPCGAVVSSKSNLCSPELPDGCNDLGSAQKSQIEEITMCKEIKPEGKDLSRVPLTEELVPIPNQLFWKNSDSLCWLDSLLVALVNCKSLKNCKPLDEPRQSAVWRLMKAYEDICVAVQAHQTESDGVRRVPSRFLQKANNDLQSLRMSVFKALEPKLRCKLGQRETPVFAMPLLLSMDSWAECLFQAAFCWEFKCGSCRAASKERLSKTISTCTNLMPDWRPLHAVHTAPCSVCRSRNQKRTMKLVRLPPVFALHFVEGLPRDDVGAYSFDFQGKHYSVTTIIQYDQRLKHFVTWIRRSDGSWLEYDDLKHPVCQTHEKLPVPAEQLHVLFWEAEESNDSGACSPSSTSVEAPPSESQGAAMLNGGNSRAEDPDRSFSATHNDTDIVRALSTSDAEGDTSLGASTLLDAFEGLSHTDIITLTLVDLNAESDTKSHGSQQSPEASVSSQSEAVTTTADASSTAVDGGKGHSSDLEGHTSRSSSETESRDSLSSDPTYTPSARAGRAGVVTRSRQKAAQAEKAPAAAPSSRASSKTSVQAPDPDPAPQNGAPCAELPQQASPVSPVTPVAVCPPSTTQDPVQPTLESNTRLSYLLSKRPRSQVQKSTAQPARSSAQRRPVPPFHSTPSTVKRPQPPALTQLSTEDAAGLPPKAAEMYGAFGAKRSNGLAASSPPPPVTSNHLNTAGRPTVSRFTHEAALKKQSSDLPPGPSSTDALRLKLLKKLKAKKKKLARLNKLLGMQGDGSLQPDSTDLGSPSTVTSSTYDDFLSDLLSPATTASNLSPDSTEFLEMLANGKDGTDQTDYAAPVPPANGGENTSNPDNFLEEFLSKAAAQTPTAMEAEALGALDLFV
ncbi:SUMO-specific isopeptidase USPL1 [Salarias fasciatus]|uniref:SUMO-specific isopeptidase USPL1 n=1 Tax=Salarias fasciatus TaxID=181472 RepID=UPI0011765A4D|nr:SUMO-specific isopeptidase USPL1 [Salarias fasciatus]XP_029956670.1 SUMO-specific isopeptidase USPL1 [Salarias fasciatus]